MNTAYFPISSSGAFDNLGLPYNISAVVTPDGLFDEEAYRAYSPMFMSATLMLAYGTQFAVITAVIVHTFRMFGSHVVQWREAYFLFSLVQARYHSPVPPLYQG